MCSVVFTQQDVNPVADYHLVRAEIFLPNQLLLLSRAYFDMNWHFIYYENSSIKCAGWQPCLRWRGWSWIILEVHANPSHSVILSQEDKDI